MRSLLLAATAAAAATAMATAPSVASAENLTVSTTVPSFCSIGLANVAGSTVAVANGLRQKVSTFRMSCNDPQGANLQGHTANGDLKDSSPGGHIINYDWEMVVQAPAASLGWAPADTSPGDGGAKSTSTTYSSGLANGVLADFFLNLCYKQGPSTSTLPQQDNSLVNGSSGCFPTQDALSAPAGTYTETFTFTLNPL